MITRTVLMTLVFAVVIGGGAAAFALINGNGSSMGQGGKSYSSAFYGGSDYGDHDDHDDHDDDDD